MGKLFKKPLIYLLTTMLVLPTWLVIGINNVERVKAAEGVTIASWNFDDLSTNPDAGSVSGASFSENSDGTSTYVQGNPNTGKAYSSNDWQADEYYEVDVPTSGYKNIRLSFDDKASATGPTQYQVKYSTDGTAFTDLSNGSGNISLSFSTSPMKSFDFSEISALNNNPNSKIRITVKNQGTHSAGTWTIDNVSVKGDDIVLPSGTIKINDGSAYTNSPTVNLSLSKVGDLIPIQMMLSDNPDLTSDGLNTTSGTWQAFSATVSNWKLIDGDGTKNVYVRFKDSDGHISSIINTSIILETVKPTVNAGSDAEAVSTYTTNANASDSGSGILSYLWTATGPGTVSFGTPTLPNTTISVDVNGVYLMKLTVIDKAGNSFSDTFNLTWNAESNLSVANPNIVIPQTSTGDAVINAPSDVNNGTIGFTTTLQPDGTKSVTTSGKITINSKTTSGDVAIEIPVGTIIAGPSDWSGSVNLPSLLDKSLISMTNGDGTINTVDNALEIGFGDQLLTFSNPVKITLKGKAGKLAGYVKGGVFTPITNICDALTPPTLTDNGECKLDFDNNADGIKDDLVIWTKHFTKFVTYAEEKVIAPDFTVTALVNGDNKTIHIEWKGTGADSYLIKVNGVTNTEINRNVTDMGLTYSKNISVLNYGSYSVSVIAVKSSVSSAGNAVKAVEFKAPVVQVTVEEKLPAPSTPPTIAPQRTKAAEPKEERIETPPSTNNDDNGQIKGDEESSEESETINWTPWIVLFVLIILAGAATGGYFYWFSGDEEVAESVQEKKKTPNKPSVSVRTKHSKKPNKKAKRW